MKKLLPWLSASLILVIIFGTIYTVVQQAQRRDANYPQIQLAEDTAVALNGGAEPTGLVQGTVDMAASLAPFTIIYDKQGRVVAGSGYLGSKIPIVPIGVLTTAQGKAYHFVTWQPAPGVRVAAVSVAANNYYVLSGRSLIEVEKNETATLLRSGLGGLASLVVLGGAYLIMRPQPKR